ncbi:MAG: cytochrome c biogenesis CcdA family protein [Actinomycetota bacterium]
MGGVSIPIAFFAGLVSFLSPCVLPLVPGYLSYMSGMSVGDQGEARARHAVKVSLAFVFGFTIVFVAFGVTATVLGRFLLTNKDVLARVGGAFIILMGLIFMGAIKVPWLYREARFHPTPQAGLWGSVVLGGAFAFGWSPCIGATLGAVLTMAAGRASEGGAAQGAVLLAVYSMGLGIPFVLAGLGVSRLTTVLGWLRRHIRTVNVVSGLILVAVGLLFVTNQVFQISIWLQRNVPALESLWTL